MGIVQLLARQRAGGVVLQPIAVLIVPTSIGRGSSVSLLSAREELPFLSKSDRVPSAVLGSQGRLGAPFTRACKRGARNGLDSSRTARADASSIGNNAAVVQALGAARMHGEVHEVVGNVEARGTFVADVIEIWLALGKETRVHKFALGQQDEPVEESDNVGARLVDGEDDSPLVVLGHCDKAFNHIVGIVGVQSTSRFVEEEDGGTGDQLASNPDSSFLSSRDSTAVSFLGADKGVSDMVNAQLFLDLGNSLFLGSAAHVARKSQKRAVENRLVNGERRQHGVFLINKSNHVLVFGVVNLFTINVEISANDAALVLSSKDIQERRLSSARGAHNGSDFSRLADALDARQNLLAVEGVGDILKVEGRWLVIDHELGALVVGILQANRSIVQPAAGKIPCSNNDGSQEKRTAANHAGNEGSVDLLDGAVVAWHLRLVQAFTRLAVEEDAGVSDQADDEVVHFGLLESTVMSTAALLRAFEPAGALDRLVQKVGKVERAIFAAHHAARDAAAADVVAFVRSRVLVAGILGTRGAIGQVAVEGLDLVDPD